MGKGDPRSKRGKIYQGSFGKTRPMDPAKKKKRAAKKATKRYAPTACGPRPRGPRTVARPRTVREVIFARAVADQFQRRTIVRR